jgi:hypothetical protein
MISILAFPSRQKLPTDDEKQYSEVANAASGSLRETGVYDLGIF